MEIWKDIKNYERLYQISNLGRIRSLDRYVNGINGGKVFKRGKLLSLVTTTKGYLNRGKWIKEPI